MNEMDLLKIATYKDVMSITGQAKTSAAKELSYARLKIGKKRICISRYLEYAYGSQWRKYVQIRP